MWNSTWTQKKPRLWIGTPKTQKQPIFIVYQRYSILVSRMNILEQIQSCYSRSLYEICISQNYQFGKMRLNIWLSINLASSTFWCSTLTSFPKYHKHWHENAHETWNFTSSFILPFYNTFINEGLANGMQQDEHFINREKKLKIRFWLAVQKLLIKKETVEDMVNTWLYL